MKEQPSVALVGWVAALETEGGSGSDEVDQQEPEEVDDEFLEAGGGGSLGVIVQVHKIVDDAGDEHHVDEGRNERKEHLEDENVGQTRMPDGLFRTKARRCFQTACSVPNDAY